MSTGEEDIRQCEVYARVSKASMLLTGYCVVPYTLQFGQADCRGMSVQSRPGLSSVYPVRPYRYEIEWNLSLR